MNLLVNSSLRLFTLVLFEWAPKTQKAGKKKPWLANWLFQNIFQSVTLCVQIHKNSDFYQKKPVFAGLMRRGCRGYFDQGQKRGLGAKGGDLEIFWSSKFSNLSKQDAGAVLQMWGCYYFKPNVPHWEMHTWHSSTQYENQKLCKTFSNNIHNIQVSKIDKNIPIT